MLLGKVKTKVEGSFFGFREVGHKSVVDGTVAFAVVGKYDRVLGRTPFGGPHFAVNFNFVGGKAGKNK